MSRTFCIADLHLENNPLSEYRWRVFDWIGNLDIDRLLILGDLTEKKDNHSSKLVNRLISKLHELPFEVIILRGNHDYYDESFFKFLSYMENIHFIDNVYSIDNMLFVPHGKELTEIDFTSFDYVFLHHQFKGSVLMNGYILDEGIDASIFNSYSGRVLSGHIHKKGTVGNVEYIGSPYPVYFGDNDYKGRGIFLEENREFVFNDCIARWGITLEHPSDIGNFNIKKDDQVKVKIKLDEDKMYKWGEIKSDLKEYLTDIGAVVVSLEVVPIKNIKVQTFYIEEDRKQIFDRFCKLNNLDAFISEVGRELL